MTKLETILQEVGTLFEAEQARLIEFLIERSSAPISKDEDVAVGQRGLMAWTGPRRLD